MTTRRLIVLVLLVALLALTPLAQASSPDQTWIGGFYDDADLDEIVLLVTGGLHAVECEPVPVLLPVSDVIALVPAMPKDATPGPVPLSEADRGPPLS